MFNPILGRSVPFIKYFTFQPIRQNHIRPAIQITSIVREFPSMKAMSKQEFIEKRVVKFEEFAEEYGDIIREKGIKVEEAYQRMIQDKYNNYLRHQEVIDSGRIC